MAAISKIKIDGFKAFPKEFELVLDGKNLLMYGENGSGKSSIYYTLHALLQSQYHDKGSIYFDKNNSESLVNKYTTTVDPYIELELEGSNTKYHLSKNGYKELPAEAISPLRDMNAECVFINHKFLFNSFSFRNSQYIDLFPVFIKDILPFTFTNDSSKYISELYDEVVTEIQRRGNGRKIDPNYDRLIEKFNQEVLRIIEKINHKEDINAPSLVSNIYNNHFRDSDDRELSIELNYENNRDHIPQPNKSYWLRYGYRYQQTTIAHRVIEECVSRKLEILPPVIRLTIKEKKDNGTWGDIEKPQTQLNEAKLTAIILSIRFSLLDLVAAPDGRFLALDDMLISLDMSNRVKVIKFLLQISNKYKIYLFTHDRAFFELTKDFVKEKIKDYKDNWLFKEIYNDIILKNNPVCYDSEDTYTRAIYHYKKFDYPASANYLRKSVEELMQFFPQYISRTEDGLPKEKLRAKIDAAKYLFECTDGDTTDIQTIIFSLGTLLNPLSHRSIDTNIYHTELDTIIKVIPKVKQHILKLDVKEIVAVENAVYLFLDENDTTKCEIKINLKTPLYSFLAPDGFRKLSITKGDSIESITIKNEIREAPQQFTYYKGKTLEEICQQIHSKIGKRYAGNYVDFYKDKDGHDLKSFL